MPVIVEIHEFSSTDWELLSEPDKRIVAFNPSGTPISLCWTDTEDSPESPTDIVEIGGLYMEYTPPEDIYVWAKSSTGGGFLRVRPYGTVDPESDTQQLGQAINNLASTVQAHLEDLSDPHDVTKDQVDLGNIPNAISDDPEVDSGESLATSKGLNTVHSDLQDHKNNKDNPHEVTKNDVKLGQVQNYSIATPLQSVDPDCTDAYMTPATTSLAIAQLTEVAYSTPPQIVVKGNIVDRPIGWNYSECSAPVELITKVKDRTVQVNAGLQVSFACDYKSRLSLVLEDPIEFILPPELHPRFYIYVDLTRSGSIVEAGATHIRPQVVERKEGKLSDLFSPSDCTMYDSEDNTIQRVYIGKIYMADKDIVKIVSAPIGENHILPLESLLAQNKRHILPNPYLEEVDIVPEVFHNETWGASGWNDQIGVAAHSYPMDPIDTLVVQSGLMGLIACGQESGSSFGLTFPTVTSPVRVRLHLKKRYR